MDQPVHHGLNIQQSPPRRLLFLICPGGYSFVEQYPTVLARLATWARLVCVTSEVDFVTKWNVWIRDPTYRVAGFVLVDGAIFELQHRSLMQRLVELPRRIVPYQRPVMFSADSRQYDQAPNPEFRYAVALNAVLWASSHPVYFNHWLRQTWDITWQVLPGVSAAAAEFSLGRVAREARDLIAEAWFHGAFESRAVFVKGPASDPPRVWDRESVLQTSEDVLVLTREEAEAEYEARTASPWTMIALPERDNGVLRPDVEPIYTRSTGETLVTYRIRPLHRPSRRRRRGGGVGGGDPQQVPRILQEHCAATLNVSVPADGPLITLAFIGVIDDIPEVAGLILDVCNVHDGVIRWTAPEYLVSGARNDPAEDESARRTRPRLDWDPIETAALDDDGMLGIE